MRSMLFGAAIVAMSGWTWLVPQDPPRKAGATTSRPKPPAKAAPLAPVAEPPRSAIERRDLLQRFRPRSPLEGIFRLVSWQTDTGKRVPGVVGYLTIGQAHLSLHLQAPGRRKATPLMQAGFRRYRVQGNKLITTNLVGHRNQPNGNIAIEPPGRIEARRYELAGSKLRVYQGSVEHMEFVRIE